MVSPIQRLTSAGNPFAATQRLISLDKALDDLLHLLHSVAADILPAHFRATSPKAKVVVVFTIGRFTCVKNASVLLLAYLSSMNYASRLTTIWPFDSASN